MYVSTNNVCQINIFLKTVLYYSGWITFISLLLFTFGTPMFHVGFMSKRDLTLRYEYNVPCLSIIYCLYPLIKNLGKFLDIHLIYIHAHVLSKSVHAIWHKMSTTNMEEKVNMKENFHVLIWMSLHLMCFSMCQTNCISLGIRNEMGPLDLDKPFLFLFHLMPCSSL